MLFLLHDLGGLSWLVGLVYLFLLIMFWGCSSSFAIVMVFFFASFGLFILRLWFVVFKLCVLIGRPMWNFLCWIFVALRLVIWYVKVFANWFPSFLQWMLFGFQWNVLLCVKEESIFFVSDLGVNVSRCMARERCMCGRWFWCLWGFVASWPSRLTSVNSQFRLAMVFAAFKKNWTITPFWVQSMHPKSVTHGASEKFKSHLQPACVITSLSILSCYPNFTGFQ